MIYRALFSIEFVIVLLLVAAVILLNGRSK